MRPYFYELDGKIGCVSNSSIEALDGHSVVRFPKDVNSAIIFFQGDPRRNAASFPVTSTYDYLDHDRLDRLQHQGELASSLADFIPQGMPTRAVNLLWPGWKSLLELKPKKRKGLRLNLVALGDVGSTLLIGLCLLGGDCIDEIGIYDRDPARQQRFVLETNQILAYGQDQQKPKVRAIDKDQVFDGDCFVFCASKGIPPLSQTSGDVRMVQLEGNRMILKDYAIMARLNRFQGDFCVVSDPVDPLCQAAYLDSNTSKGSLDFKGLRPEQIHGFGLGVMYARAAYLAESLLGDPEFLRHGRAFGPHGKGLVVINDLDHYDQEKSQRLTQATLHANHLVRETGFKPYIAPALSSGALSILSMLRGRWHLSANFLGGVYFGAANRLTDHGVDFERLRLPPSVVQDLIATHKALEDIL